jgi:hypothetical protein
LFSDNASGDENASISKAMFARGTSRRNLRTQSATASIRGYYTTQNYPKDPVPPKETSKRQQRTRKKPDIRGRSLRQLITTHIT